jgi:hypothetical protein
MPDWLVCRVWRELNGMIFLNSRMIQMMNAFAPGIEVESPQLEWLFFVGEPKRRAAPQPSPKERVTIGIAVFVEALGATIEKKAIVART